MTVKREHTHTHTQAKGELCSLRAAIGSFYTHFCMIKKTANPYFCKAGKREKSQSLSLYLWGLLIRVFPVRLTKPSKLQNMSLSVLLRLWASFNTNKKMSPKSKMKDLPSPRSFKICCQNTTRLAASVVETVRKILKPLPASVIRAAPHCSSP